jgi:hypothetical protein
MGMSMWKVNTPNTIVVDLSPNDIYAASGFNLFTKYADETSPTKQDVEFVEIIDNSIGGGGATVSADVAKGSYEIPVDDTSWFQVGMRFKVTDADGNDKGIYFYVSKVTDTSVIARRALSGDITNGDKIEQVGNTGIYEASFTPDKLGVLTFLVNNPSIGLQNETAKAQVVSNLVDDVVADVNTSYNDLLNRLGDIQNSLGTAGSSTVVGRLIV